MSDDLNINKGTLLILETGEYSDRDWSGPYLVEKDFNRTEIAEKFKSEWKQTDEWYDHPRETEFGPWLIKNGYISDAGISTSWHIGSYERFDP